jgi:hypothetical protein
MDPFGDQELRGRATTVVWYPCTILSPSFREQLPVARDMSLSRESSTPNDIVFTVCLKLLIMIIVTAIPLSDLVGESGT